MYGIEICIRYEQDIQRNVASMPFPEIMLEELKLLANKKDVPYQSSLTITNTFGNL